MELESRIQALIAVGAAVSANCQPCLQAAVTRALESEANQREIAEAIEVGKRVRRGAASKMDSFAVNLSQMVPLTAVSTAEGCGCSSGDYPE